MPTLILNDCYSVMENSLATVARYITTHVYSVRGKRPRQKCTLEGEFAHTISLDAKRSLILTERIYRFVEMLESHHSLVVKALQKLYKFCINKEDFPGEPLAETPDGHPLTHAILDRLGLIKQAEENADEPDEDSEDLRYLRLLSTSTECSATAEPSPEPTTPPEPSPTTISSRPSICNSLLTPMMSRSSSTWQWDLQSVQQASYTYPDPGYHDMLGMQQRPSITSADLSAGEISPHIDIPSTSSISHGAQTHEQQSFAYFLDGTCNAATASSEAKNAAVRLHSGIMPETHPHQMGGLSSDLLSDFQFPTHEPSLYPEFTPGWSFPSA